LKILFVSPSFYPATYYGGPVYSTYNTARTLANAGVQVYVVTTNSNGNKKLNVKTNKFINIHNNLNVKYYALGSKRGFSFLMFLFLWNDIRKVNIIYLVSVFSPPTPLTLFLSIVLRKKIILSPQGQIGEWGLNQGSSFKKLWLSFFIKPSLKKITWNVCSVQEKKDILKVYPQADIIVTPNIVEVSEFESNNKERDFSVYKKLTGKDLSKKKVIISLGRLHKVKGFDILIKALDLLKEDHPELVLLIAGGDFGEKERLQHLINSLDLNGKVFLVGNIEGKDKLDFLLNADIFALASHHENFGIVYAEAMAAALPVVAGKNTPWQEVEEFDCGKWVDNSPEDFAAAISELLNSDYHGKGLKGRKLIEDKYNIEKASKQIIEQFKKILI
jgi:glycosyltransferase involved in cell wall biosynthesis